ncbi:MAG: NADH-quinone oxidoreductase subunit A [Pirellulaceae bacterium]|nr:NADH-quinone oxidoreductase subunit A [Pirellulaceae bacterium]
MASLFSTSLTTIFATTSGMAISTSLVAYLVLFVFIGSAFVLANLLIGRLLRPRKPHPEKAEIYECGESTIGSSYIQFDIRFYVIALLFIIFDVEVVFFFPWAILIGKAIFLRNSAYAIDESSSESLKPLQPTLAEMGLSPASQSISLEENSLLEIAEGANLLAWVGALDMLLFVSILLVGFAYLWKRGDLDWIRSYQPGNKSIHELLSQNDSREP